MNCVFSAPEGIRTPNLLLGDAAYLQNTTGDDAARNVPLTCGK